MIYIIHRITAGPFQENGYIIHPNNKKDCIIIDPGDSPQDYINKIQNLALNPIAILNTHGHIDHIHAIQPIKEQFLIPFYIHENEKMYIDHYSQGCLMYGMVPNKKPEVDVWLNKEGKINIGEFEIDLIFTPGHTTGGSCFLFEDDLFTGDTLFAGSIGRTDFPGGDYGTLMHSIKRLIDKVKPGTTVHSGHGPSTTIEQEIISNPFLADLNK